jgi:hypothetical protein
MESNHCDPQKVYSSGKLEEASAQYVKDEAYVPTLHDILMLAEAPRPMQKITLSLTNNATLLSSGVMSSLCLPSPCFHPMVPKARYVVKTA